MSIVYPGPTRFGKVSGQCSNLNLKSRLAHTAPWDISGLRNAKYFFFRWCDILGGGTGQFPHS